MTELQTKRAEAPLKGEVLIASDKSISHRSVILSAIYDKRVLLDSLLESADVLATINAFRAMGVNIERKFRGVWAVSGVGLHGLKKPEKNLNMGNSGTSARLIMGILAGQDFESIIDGDESLRKRPMKRVTDPLSQMGAKFEFLENDGCLPIKITGNPKLKPLQNYKMPVASAQIKSAILLAGLYADGETSIIEKEISRDHTERMMEQFLIDIDKIDGVIILKPRFNFSNQHSVERLRIPADASSAAFFIAAALLVEDSEISFTHMSVNKTRTGFMDAIKEILKVDIETHGNSVAEGESYAHETITRYTEIAPSTYTISAEYAPRMIDEYPILAVLAAGSKATVRMEGIGELRVKESDRIAVMEKGLKACGVDVESGEDWMEVRGTGKVKGGAKIETHLDHRIAMCFIILGLIAENPITIDDISPIKTSFAYFFEQLKKLGVHYNPVGIAIDGLAAAGKGTLARRIAEHYDYAYLDSGKLYRLIAKELLDNNEKLTSQNAAAIAQKFSYEIPFELISDPALMQDEVGSAASIIAAFPEVRTAIKNAQQDFATNPHYKGTVIDGRDIGTVICPEAQVKLYITADAKTRALRRLKELGKPDSSYPETLAAIQKRDSDDQNRPIAPLKKADDATEIDTSKLTIDEAFQACLKIINEKIASL